MDMREESGKYIQYLNFDLILPLKNQDYTGEGKDFWCIDWWVIELAKYFFEGEVNYLGYPKARRLEDNETFQKDKIVEACRDRISKFKAVDHESDTAYLVEKARGFDTLLLRREKDWKRICVRVNGEFPDVVSKTREYLSRYNNVVIVDDELYKDKQWVEPVDFYQSF